MINIEDYSQIKFSCKCGKIHSSYTKHIICESGAINKIADLCKLSLKCGTLGIVYDKKLSSCAGSIEEILKSNSYKTILFEFDDKDDIKTCNALLNAQEDIRLWIAIGTGKIANCVKYVSSQRHNEWICVMSAPTTDSILYPYSEYIHDCKRELIECNPPVSLIADLDIIQNAPKQCIASGYGTLVSKLLRLFDLKAEKIVKDNDCNELYNIFNENLMEFFENQSATSLQTKICVTLIRLGIISQFCPIDYLQGVEYDIACDLCNLKKERLLGENLMLICITVFCVLRSYLANQPDNLFIPCDINKKIRYLDKQCNKNSLVTYANYKKDQYSASYMLITKEYADDLICDLNYYLSAMKGKIKCFRRIYKDLGLWLGEYMTIENLHDIVCASASVSNKSSLFKSIVLSGAIDCLEKDIG